MPIKSEDAAEESAIDFVESWVKRQGLKPGDRLPSARNLARYAGVVLRAMTEAIARLKAEGYLNGVQRGPLRLSINHTVAARPPSRNFEVWRLKRSMFERDLHEGRFAGHDTLPALKELQLRYGVCFATMRKILRSMIDDGVVHLRGKHYVLHNQIRSDIRRRIVLIVDSSRNPPHSALNTVEYQLIDSLERECVRREMQLDIVEIDHQDTIATVQRGFPMTFAEDVRGYVLAVKWSAEPEIAQLYDDILRRLALLKKPVAVLDQFGNYTLPAAYAAHSQFQTFRVEGHRAGAQIAGLLLKLGHRSVVYISSHHDELWSQQRFEGIHDRFRLTGLSENVHAVVKEGSGNHLLQLLLLSGLDDAVVRRVLLVGRTKMQAADEFKAFDKMRKEQIPFPISSALKQEIRTDLSIIADMDSKGCSESTFNLITKVLVEKGTRQLSTLQCTQLFERASKIPQAGAWVCANDFIALAALNFARSRGMKIPSDLSVIGFNNSSAQSLEAKLTSYDFNTAGFMHHMLDSISGPALSGGKGKNSAIEVRGSIIVRQTTGAPKHEQC